MKAHRLLKKKSMKEMRMMKTMMTMTMMMRTMTTAMKQMVSIDRKRNEKCDSCHKKKRI
jgi:hypothetical protein